MIKINNVPIINPITTFTHNQKEKISFVCDSGTVLWELLRIPTSCNDPVTKIGWNTSTEQTSAELTDYLILQLSGTYKIQITYTSTSGVIVRYMIIIEALSLKDTATIPFGGESVEMNTQEGWAKKVEKNLQLLSQNNGNFSIIGVYEVYDLIVGDLVCISDIKDTYQSGFIYEIMRAEDYTAQNGIVGIVIDVKESGGSVEYDIDGKYYTVAFKGAFLLDSFPLTEGNIYYNYTTHELTDIEVGNLFVGKYTNGVLVIENEMWFDVEVYIPSAMTISKDLNITKTKQLNFVGENVEVSGDLNPDVTTNVTVLGQWLSLNGLSYGRTAKYLNFVSVDDEITINHVVGTDYSDIIIKEYPFFRDDDESLIYSKHSGDISTPLEGDSFVVGSDNLNVDYARKMFFNKPLGSFGVGELLNVTGFGAFSTGSGNTSIGDNSQSFGINTQALTNISFSSGFQTTASGYLGSHAEGNSSVASGDYGSHAEGFQTTASGDDAHSEGWLTQAIGNESHAEGHLSIASGTSSHAEGENTKAEVDYSHAEGNGTTASGTSSHAEGDGCKAIGNFGSHAEGYKSIAEGGVSHAEGQECTAIGGVSHAEGYKSIAEGGASHAEGYKSIAEGGASHAEGQNTTASGLYSHAEGNGTTASVESSHAEGQNTTASGLYSHAEGNGTTASVESSHAEGEGTIASERASHAEGYYSIASGDTSHAEGGQTTASAFCSHAEGKSSVARYDGSHAFANGKFAVAGDAQGERLCRKAETTSIAPVTLLSIELPENAIFAFRGDIVVRKESSLVGYFIEIDGLIYRNGNGGATIIGTPNKTVKFNSNTDINENKVVISANVYDLKITVAGIDAETYKWVCTLNLTELITENPAV